MTETKQIGGTPAPLDMVRPFGLSYRPVGHRLNGYETDTVVLTVPEVEGDGTVRFPQVEYTLDQFYELRESVEAMYQHIRDQSV